MSEFRFVCRPCFDVTGQMVPVVDRPFEDGSGGEWVCQSVEAHVSGFYLLGGELDLGVIRDSSPSNADNGFTVRYEL